MLVLPQRNPVVLAKVAATLDVLSGGRLTLGIGIGWLKEEKMAVGVSVEHPGRRCEEYIMAMRELWTKRPASFRGEHCEFDAVHCLPGPVNGTVPVLVGGHTVVAARRAGRVADGFFAWDLTPEDLAPLIEEVRNAAVDAGRDRDSIELTAGGPRMEPAAVDRYAELGVSRVVLSVGAPLEDLAARFITK